MEKAIQGLIDSGMDHVNLIIDNLWLGNIIIANDENFIRDNNIKLVINCTRETKIPEWYEKYNIQAIRLPINDYNGNEENIILRKSINELINIIDDYRRVNKPVLVHCFAGMQRSATVIASYLKNKYTFSGHNAMLFTKHKRKVAFHPSATFESFILENN
jgi:protein-tyrosine phosphatase